MPLGQDHISCPLYFCALYLKCESLSLSYKEAGGCRAEGHDSPSIPCCHGEITLRRENLKRSGMSTSLSSSYLWRDATGQLNSGQNT